MATPVHNHSEYSALDGYSKVDEIADRIESLGMNGAFITDHGIIAGWRSFQNAMQKRDLFAGLGMEAYQAAKHRNIRPSKQRDQAHLLLLAQNAQGIKNLMRMADESNRTGFYFVPRVDWEILEQYSEGIICTSACMGGLLSQAIINDGDPDALLSQYLKVFGDNFFIEIHTYPTEEQKRVNLELVGMAKNYGVPVVYANDAHYCAPDEYLFHEVLLAVQYRQVFDGEKLHHPQALYIMGENDVRDRLSYLGKTVVDECIRNSDLIAEMCKEAQLSKPRMHLPVFKPIDGGQETNTERIIRYTEEGCAERYKEITPEVEERAVLELGTIIDAGLVDYFLITKDFCDFADRSGIQRGPGRGSAGGSLVAYALGITDIDPLRYKLYFERFYNAGRDKGLPDIDIDFETKRRGEIDDYLKERFGEYHVAPIGTHIRLKPKLAIERVGKALAVPVADINAIKKIIDKVPDIGIMSADQIGWRSGEGIVVSIFDHEETYERLLPYIKKHPDLFDVAEAITGRIASYGIHASAIVVSDVDLREELPVMNREDKGTKKRLLATQVEMHEVENNGFPKFDRLGLRNLDTLEAVRRMTGGDWDYRDIDWDALPEGFWQLIDKGLTLGLFQIEEGNARGIGMRLKPRSIEDLAAIVALNRPGPLRDGVDQRFIARRSGAMPIVYPHNLLKDILAESYGDFIYQEQVIGYFRALGYNANEADDIRKMLGKKLVAKMNEEYPRYLEHALNFMGEKQAKNIWDSIINFSKYSFNKSHAVLYGLILARTMYAKWKYPAEFIMASIQTNPDEAGAYVIEGRRMGVSVEAPDINRSEVTTKMVDGTIYYGLSDVKGVGEKAADWIIENRPYTSYEDFMQKQNDACSTWEAADKEDRSPRSPRQVAPANMVGALRKVGAFASIGDTEYDDEQIADFQEELLGVSIIDTTAETINSNIDEIVECGSMMDIEDADVGDLVTFPAIVQSSREAISRNGNKFGYVKLTWEGLEYEIITSPKNWQAYAFLFRKRSVGIFTVKVTDRGASFEQGRKLFPQGQQLHEEDAEVVWQ